MKILTSFLFVCLLSVYAKAQTLKYFDTDGKEIQLKEFNEALDTRKYLAIKTDSSYHKQLVERYQTGTIPTFSDFKKSFNHYFTPTISNSTLVIIYYPGKDACNSSGIATEQTKKEWYGALDKGVKKLTKLLPIYISKDKNDMDDKGSAILDWKDDPEHLIEKTFFHHHYPCGSFVVIAPNGQYISYFGEYSKEQIWNAVKTLNKNSD